MTDLDYDPANHTRPKRGKRVSLLTGKMTNLNPETEIQIICFTHYERLCRYDADLRQNTRLFAISPNDGRLTVAQRTLSQRMGKKRGPWDAQFYDKRGGTLKQCWIEFKAPDGRLTPEQRGYLDWLRDTPIRAVEVRGLDEFTQIIGDKT